MKKVQKLDSVSLSDFISNYTEYDTNAEITLPNIFHLYKKIFPSCRLTLAQFGSLFNAMCQGHYNVPSVSKKSRKKSKIYYIRVLKKPSLPGINIHVALNILLCVALNILQLALCIYLISKKCHRYTYLSGAYNFIHKLAQNGDSRTIKHSFGACISAL